MSERPDYKTRWLEAAVDLLPAIILVLCVLLLLGGLQIEIHFESHP